jgi:hypothetical protein
LKACHEKMAEMCKKLDDVFVLDDEEEEINIDEIEMTD